MNDFIVSSAAIMVVFLVGYFALEKRVPKNKKSYLITSSVLVASGVILFFLFYESLIVKAISWGLIWLGVIAINKMRLIKPV